MARHDRLPWWEVTSGCTRSRWLNLLPDSAMGKLDGWATHEATKTVD
ncbi:MAG: hypothetical protein HOM68_10140 [Gemmatimonadetes bacterium]|nr:hypothetical protein [Gemmatimonadota bacterium]MBT4608717.1 hypothetical protein [Gemmatimonadota bacterium]MBT5056886.1 hypothetical protein [Gemmatimonadota bacterium]MBT5144056.1 hypothetical protein [Gemmatimonadota bacterium]MBT7594705.1 hypothetical protein [Gemmatimonadota bacterium]